MGKRLGNLIRAARTDAGFTQAQLANKIAGVSASDVGRYERGEAEPTQQVVKEIAKACGVTQKSLLDAMPKSTSKSTTRSSATSSKTTKTSTSKTTTAKSSTAKSSTTNKTTSTAKTVQLTTTEKRLVDLYRAADADKRKKAIAILDGSDDGVFGPDDVIAGIGDFFEDILGKK